MQAQVHQGSVGISGELEAGQRSCLQPQYVNVQYNTMDKKSGLSNAVQACQERIKGDETGEAHCTGQVRFR